MGSLTNRGNSNVCIIKWFHKTVPISQGKKSITDICIKKWHIAKTTKPQVFVKIMTPLVAYHLVNYTYPCHSNNLWLKPCELKNYQLSNELFSWLFFTNVRWNWHSLIPTASIVHTNKSSVVASCSHFLTKR